MLSSMTLYIDHHDVLLESGVLPALMSNVSNSKVEPTVSATHGCKASSMTRMFDYLSYGLRSEASWVSCRLRMEVLFDRYATLVTHE